MHFLSEKLPRLIILTGLQNYISQFFFLKSRSVFLIFNKYNKYIGYIIRKFKIFKSTMPHRNVVINQGDFQVH